MMTLEELLQKHFGLKGNLYLKKPKIIGYYGGGYSKEDADYQKETDKGAEAYSKMIGFIYDLFEFANIDDVNDLVDKLDNELDGGADFI